MIYVWPADLKRHLKSKHGQQNSTLKQQQPYTFTPEQQPYIFTSEQQQQQYTVFPDKHEIQSKTEEPYYMIQTNNPYTCYVVRPDKYDPNHFMLWVNPFTSVNSGQTGSGKSVFVRRFVHNIRHMMTPIPECILWCYEECGSVDGVDFQQGLPDLDTLDPRDKHLIILDDIMDGTKRTKGSHHRNISVMCIVQNLFHRGKHHSLNAHFMVLLKNPRDVSQIIALAHQMYPRRTHFFLEPYVRVTARPHGYMVIDMKQNTPDILRLRTFIFPGEEQKAYVDSSKGCCISFFVTLASEVEGGNMVYLRLKKHASDIVYLQKTKPCIRKHLIT